MNSEKYSLSWQEAVKGLVVAVAGAVLTFVAQIINDGGLPTSQQWAEIGKIAVGAGVSYLLQKFFRNSDDTLLKAEPKELTSKLTRL